MPEISPPPKASRKSQLQIAVIGDVGTDWAFISNQPARKRSPAFQPWTKYPATHLYSFPGGAWFSGHMIQGAVADPIFMRHDGARTTHHANTIRHVVLTGESRKLPTDLAALKTSFTFIIPLEADYTKELPYAIILDDDHELDIRHFSQTKGLSKATLTIDFPPNTIIPQSPARVQSGIVNMTLPYTNSPSGPSSRIIPDQVYRHYTTEALAFAVPPHRAKPLELTFFTLEHVPFHLTLEVTVKNKSVQLFSTKPTTTSLQDRNTTPPPAKSLRLIPTSLRHGAFSNAAPLKLSASAKCSLSLDTGYVDVTYGTFETDIHTIDKGKFNAPQIQMEPLPNLSSHPLKVRLVAQDSQSLEIPHRLWLYENPRTLLAMQHPGHVVHTLSELDIYKRHPDQKGPTKVYRRKLIHGIDGPRHGYPTILNSYDTSTYALASATGAEVEPRDVARKAANLWAGKGHRLVVIDDEGTGFSSRHLLWSPFLWNNEDVTLDGEESDFYEPFARKLGALRDGDKGHVDSYLASTFVIIKASHWLNPPRSTLVEFLTSHKVKDRAILIISAESLRGGLVNQWDTTPGIKLAKTVSWEKTLEDFEVALNDERIKPLLKFSHIVIRLGLEGAILWSRSLGKDDGSTRLVFDPSKIEGEYSESEDLGQFPGLTTVFTAAIARDLAACIVDAKSTKEASQKVDYSLTEAIKYGLTCARRYFDLGYGPTPDIVRKFEHLQLPISQTFGRDTIEGCRSKGKHSFAVYPSVNAESDRQSEATAAPQSRSILASHLSEGAIELATEPTLINVPDDRPALVRAYNAMRLARTIVRQGPEGAFKDIAFPYARFGKLLTADRREIEGLRSIRSVLSEYIHHDERKIPLSVAVFGPPGCGKSFGVQQIAEGLAADKIEKFVFNLAQFGSFEELSRLLLEVRDAGIDEKLPLVFFDEFDSTLNNDALGWLKLFLAPMQDGRFQYEKSTLGIGKAIFVFAGGIASSHATFVDNSFWDKRYGRSEVFRSAKGTDFHSRLRGFLDISGTNANFVSTRHGSQNVATPEQVKAELYRAEDFAYVIRRALLIRQIIERLSEESKAKLLDEERHAEIDGDVLNALLLTEEYRHGVRSIEAVFQMSSLHGERVVSKTCLPSPRQLAMHVDDSFVKILTRKYAQLGSRVLESALGLQARERPSDEALTLRSDYTYYLP